MNKVINEIEPGEIPLTISPETVCFIIVKAREFDAKDVVTDPDPGSNASDDGDRAVLEDHSDDPVVREIAGAIADLSIDEEVDLVALAWLGRSDYTADDWDSVRQQAEDEHNNRTARYLLGMPLLADYLEEGLTMIGYSCTDTDPSQL